MKTEPPRFGSRPKMCLMPTGMGGGNWRLKRTALNVCLYSWLWLVCETVEISTSCQDVYSVLNVSVTLWLPLSRSLRLWWAARRPRRWALLRRGQTNNLAENWRLNCSLICSEVWALLSSGLVLKPGLQWLVNGWGNTFIRSPSVLLHSCEKSITKKTCLIINLHSLRRVAPLMHRLNHVYR